MKLTKEVRKMDEQYNNPTVYVNEEEPKQNEKKSQIEQYLSNFATAIITATDKLGDLADKKPSKFLMGFGAVIMLIPILSRIDINWFFSLKLAPTEFIVTILCGVLLVLTGAYFRLFQYRTKNKIYGEVQELGADIVRKTLDIGEDIIKKGQVQPDEF